MNVDNQYRFYLESAHRLIIDYDTNFLVTNPILGTSNQLNTLIGYGLNLSEPIYFTNSAPRTLALKTAHIKFKIPCVGYFNNSSTEMLPEFFMTNYTNISVGASYHVAKNLRVNSNLYVGTDITAFSTYYTSDRNLKHDITDLNNCYDIIHNLNPVGFKWIKNNEESVGFIAQEVEKIIPSIVKTDNNNYKVLAETKIITYLVGAIQELDKELRELEEYFNL
jgi:hypothetical protein